MQALQTFKQNILKSEVSTGYKNLYNRRALNQMIQNYTTNGLQGGGTNEEEKTLPNGTVLKGIFHINTDPAFQPKLKSGTMTFTNGCTLTGDFNFRGRLKHGVLKDKAGAIIESYEQQFPSKCKNKIGADLEECYKNNHSKKK